MRFQFIAARISRLQLTLASNHVESYGVPTIILWIFTIVYVRSFTKSSKCIVSN